MNRRGFLTSCLALGAAPAIVRADSLMRIVPRDLVLCEMTLEEALVHFHYYAVPRGLIPIRQVGQFVIAKTFKEAEDLLRQPNAPPEALVVEPSKHGPFVDRFLVTRAYQ